MPPKLHPPRTDDDILIRGRRWLRLSIVIGGACLLVVEGSGLALPRWAMAAIFALVVAVAVALQFAVARRADAARRRAQRTEGDARPDAPTSREPS